METKESERVGQRRESEEDGKEVGISGIKLGGNINAKPREGALCLYKAGENPCIQP